MSCDCDEQIAVYPPGEDVPIQAWVGTKPTARGGVGTPYVQANVESILLTLSRIYDGVSYTVTGYDEEPLTVADVLSDTLAPWDRDSIGFNFAHTIPFEDLTATASYQARYQFNLAGGGSFAVVQEFLVQGPVDAGPLPVGPWRGAWSSAATYAINEAVEHHGSSYIATAENTNSEPPSANWDLLAAGGEDGSGDGSFNVEDYGAVGDGATASNTAIQSALTAAAAYTALSTRNFADVLVPRGVYVITSLNLSGDRIRLRGNGATFTKSANGSETQMLYVGGTDCEVHDITIDGQYPTYTSSDADGGFGLNIGGVNGIYRNIRVLNVGGRAIQDAEHAWNNRLYNCYTENSGISGIRTRGDRFEVHDCEIVDWNARNPSGEGNSGFLADSTQFDADSLLVDGLVMRMTQRRNCCKAILVDPGDNAATGGSSDYIDLGNGGAATNYRGKAQFTIDRGHGYLVGDGFLVDGTGVYDGVANAGKSHKIIAVTGAVYVRAVSTTTLTLHDTAAGARANTGVVDLTTTGTGSFKIKCPGALRRSVTCSTGVNTSTNVITTDAAHGFRTGDEARITINDEDTDALPGGLANTATITTNSTYTSAGASGYYTRPKRYRHVKLNNLTMHYYPGVEVAGVVCKLMNIMYLDVDKYIETHPDTTGTESGVADTSIESLRLACVNRAIIRDSVLQAHYTNNVRSWLNRVEFHNTEIGVGPTPPTYAMQEIQQSQLVLNGCKLRFSSAAIQTPEDIGNWRDDDAEFIDIHGGTVFEGVSTSLTRILRCEDATHLGRTRILRYATNNIRRNVGAYAGFTFTAATSDTITASGHCLETGDVVTVSSTIALPLGLSANTPYFVRRLSATTLTLHTNLPGAADDTNRVDIQDTGSGVHVLLGEKIGCALSFASPRDIQFFQKNGDGRAFMDVAAPTNSSFEYRAGDIVWNMNPASGAVLGWICTKTGVRGTTAATFVAMATLP